LGYPVSRGDAEAVFRQLDMTPVAHDGEIEVEVPGYRVDIEAEVDLIEEVARVQGYDRIGSELPAIRQAGGVPATYDLRRQAREALVRAGLRETWSYSFASQADLQLMGDVDAVRVANPLAGEDVYLRISLVPGLLRALQTNLSRQADGAALFEVGRVFRLGEPIEEQDHAGLVMAGTMVGFPGEDRAFDFFDAKGAIEAVVEALRPVEWGLGEPLGEPFHPGRSAIVTAAGRAVGVLGELHPRVAAEHDLPGRTLVAEIALPAAGEWGARARASREVYRFPPARRDLAWMVDADVRAGRVQEVIREAAGAQLESCRLFDVFEGAPVPPGKKSLAFSLSFRAPERTLTDEEVDAAVASIDQRVAAEVGGELRAG